jgi:hypothetical protein
LAARFGLVIGKGRDANGAPIKADTEQHPIEHPILFRETDDPVEKIIEFITMKNNTTDVQ